MSAGRRPAPRWSVPSLVLSAVVGLGLGLAAGAAADRAVRPMLVPSGQFAVGIGTTVVVAVLVGVISYRALTRRKGTTA